MISEDVEEGFDLPFEDETESWWEGGDERLYPPFFGAPSFPVQNCLERECGLVCGICSCNSFRNCTQFLGTSYLVRDVRVRRWSHEMGGGDVFPAVEVTTCSRFGLIGLGSGLGLL